MSVRKSLLTSISSVLGEEFFSRVATTFKITETGRTGLNAAQVEGEEE